MAKPEFHISTTAQLLTVRLNVSETAPRKRFHILLLYVAIAAALIFVLLFAPGKNGSPSLWHDLSTPHLGPAARLVPPLIFLLVPVLLFLSARKYVMAAYPSDETLQCNQTCLTVSRVLWLDRSNTQWETRSFPLADIADMHLGPIATSRVSTIPGLLFLVCGKQETALPGLTPRQAGIILDAMEAFGVDRGANRSGPRRRKLKP